MNKKQLMFKVADFFSEKGKVMTLDEYRSYGTEVPVKDYHVRRFWGTWARVMQAANKLVESGTVKLKDLDSESLSFEPQISIEGEDKASKLDMLRKGANED